MNFEQLQKILREHDAEQARKNSGKLAKSHAAADFGDLELDDADALVARMRSTKMTSNKGAHAALRKSLGTLKKSMDDLEKPVLGATRVNARVAAPKRDYSPAEIEAAAHKALAAGAITGAEANHIASHLAVSGRCPDEYMAKLTGHVPKAPARLSKAQALEAAGAAIRAGALSTHEAQLLEAIIQSNNPVPPAIMKALSTAYAGPH